MTAQTFLYDAFLSHAPEDEDRAGHLAERLLEAGLRAWFVGWVPVPRDGWPLVATAALRRSRRAVALWSPAYFDDPSNWLLLDEHLARHGGPCSSRRPLVALLLEDPGSLSVPGELRRVPTFDLRRDTGPAPAFQHLLEALG